MLVTLKDILGHAQKNSYAVGLFNTTNLEMARGVIAAAEESRSPVIIGTAEVLLPFASLKELTPMLADMAKRATVPVVLHFDHGLSRELIFEALRLGFTSVMYDCSALEYENNIREVGEMVKIADAFGASLEAELGHVGANSGAAEGEDSDSSVYTDPADARDFIDKTGAYALAVAIGTAHGTYTKRPKLDIERLKAIKSAVHSPIVLHGGSGLSDADFKDCIKNGIAKINIFTDINLACARAAADNYTVGKGMTDLSNLMAEAVKNETMKKMELFGSVNRV